MRRDVKASFWLGERQSSRVKMKMLMISALALVLTLVVTAACVCAGDDTTMRIQEMVNDLGGPKYQKQNNGKVQKCDDGGTKQITITKGKGSATYKGVYKKCREYGSFRDGGVTITTGN